VTNPDPNCAICAGTGKRQLVSTEGFATCECRLQGEEAWMIFDCGDGGCPLRSAASKGGMRTNGGCQHIAGPRSTLVQVIIRLAREIVKLRKTSR
jgi:hypothetical protein